jgi:hypothetical protein
MQQSAFITPETQRLELEGNWTGHWVLVKKRLNLAEQKRLEGAIFRGIQGSGQITPDMDPSSVEVRLDSSAAYMVKLQVYLVDWSFTDSTGRHARCTSNAIDALDPKAADEVMAQLDKYLEARDKLESDPPSASSSEVQSA